MWVTLFSISKPCSISTYSTKRGSSRGLKMEHNVKCLPCPNWGNCTKEVAARPNFWGYLKILFYFYQVAGLLTVPSYGAGELLTDKIVFPITSIFDFKLYPHSDWNICPFAGLTPLTKTLTQVFVVMAIFLAILFIYLLHSGLNKLRKRTPVFPLKGPYLGAILESVLLGYSAVTGTTMRLLYCVEIQHVHRWYYNAEITCYQWWQKTTIALIILFLFPFIFMLYDGSLRLHRRQISAKKFLLACVFPLPYLLYASVVYLKKALKRPLFSQELKSKSSIVNLKENRETSLQCSLEASILEVLSVPFSKQNQDDQTRARSTGKASWLAGDLS